MISDTTYESLVHTSAILVFILRIRLVVNVCFSTWCLVIVFLDFQHSSFIFDLLIVFVTLLFDFGVLCIEKIFVQLTKKQPFQ